MLGKKWAVCVLGAGSLLAGCGGGGGDAMAVAEVALSPATYDDIAMTVTAGVVGSDAVFGAYDSVAAEGSAVHQPGDEKVLGSGRVGAIGQFALKRLTAPTSRLERPAAASEQTKSCAYGGTLAITENEADNNAEVDSPGDSLSVTATNCVLDFGAPAINGSFSVTLLAVSDVSARASMEFFNFSSDGVILNGGAVIAVDPGQLSLDYRNLTSSYRGQTLTYDYTLILRAGEARVSGLFAINRSVYTLSTPASVVLGRVYPESGVLRVEDGRGNRTEVLMYSTRFDNVLYLAGNQIPVEVTSHLWGDL